MIKPEQEYLQHLQQGKFMLLMSKKSGRCFFYPRVAEPVTGNTDLEWVEASGAGTVYSTTTVRKKLPADNYNVALIDLQEGVRMMSRVEGLAPEDVKIGMQVRARISKDDSGEVCVVFDPLQESNDKPEGGRK